MTDRRHSRPPLRRSSTPERILSAGLATAACIGVVGLLGVRTIEANAASTTSPSAADQVTAPIDLAASTDSGLSTPATTSTGLTEEQLDAYAADLAREKERLDAYRAKLVKTAKKLQRQADALRQSTGASSAPASAARTTTPAAPTAPKAKPAPAKPAPATKPAPKPAPKPAAKPAPAPKPQPAPQAQSNTKGS